jgi:hypothetical protein
MADPDSVPNSEQLPSTPPSLDKGRGPKDTTKPIFEYPDNPEILDDEVVTRLLSKKDGKPRKTDLMDVRAAKLEETLIEVPDGELDAPGHTIIDLTDGRGAMERQLKKELGRTIMVKGSARVPGKKVRETKFARLIRKMVNLAMAGDRDMIKTCLLYLGGRPALAAKEDKPSSVILQNSIPTPLEEKQREKQ